MIFVSAIGNAINLANSLCKFPQECLRADRLSAYHSTYNAQSLEEALKFESENSASVLAKESVKGIYNFSIFFVVSVNEIYIFYMLITRLFPSVKYASFSQNICRFKRKEIFY